MWLHCGMARAMFLINLSRGCKFNGRSSLNTPTGPEKSLSCGYSPTHALVTWSSVKPILQSHRKPPISLVHTWLLSQAYLSTAHSSISAKKIKCIQRRWVNRTEPNRIWSGLRAEITLRIGELLIKLFFIICGVENIGRMWIIIYSVLRETKSKNLRQTTNFSSSPVRFFMFTDFQVNIHIWITILKKSPIKIWNIFTTKIRDALQLIKY